MRKVKIYLAGKISKNDWRSRWGSLPVGCGSTEPPDGYDSSMACFEPPEIRPGVVVVGPRFLDCDHGCYHSESSHGAMQTVYLPRGPNCHGGDYDEDSEAAAHARVHAACLQQIKSCNVFFAWLGGNDAETAFGTLVELGYALALGKRIYIGTDRGHGLGNGLENLWFAVQGSKAVIHAPTPDAALDKLFGVLHAK